MLNVMCLVKNMQNLMKQKKIIYNQEMFLLSQKRKRERERDKIATSYCAFEKNRKPTAEEDRFFFAVNIMLIVL